MMEVIEALVAQDSGDFDSIFTEFMSKDLDYGQIIEMSSHVEETFLKVKDARQKWHGAAYLKLNDDQKKAYRDEYGLKERTVQNWADTVQNWFLPQSRGAGTGGGLSFSHHQSLNALAKIDREKAEELLKQAEVEELTRNELRSKATAARQDKMIEGRAERIVKNRGLSKDAALKKAMADDAEARMRQAGKEKRKAYDKAKKITEDYEKPIEEKKLFVTCDDADKALKLLYRLASKQAHSDTENGSDDLMTQVNLAKEAIKEFINKWS
jgi:hypothetical protein